MKRKVYKTREEIVAKIDVTKASQDRRSEEMEAFKVTADKCFKNAAKATDEREKGSLIVQGQEARTQERKLLKLLKRMPEKLEVLKRTLAAFDTETMFFVDKSIVEQK